MNEGILDTISQKYNLESSDFELTQAEKKALLSINVIYDLHDPVVESLHWRLNHSSLCKEFDDFKAGKLRRISPKLHLFATEERVPYETRRVAKCWLELVLGDIEKKYCKTTRIASLYRCEYQVLQCIRPLRDHIDYGATTVALHWKVTKCEIDKELEKLNSDPNYEINHFRYLNCLRKSSNVPNYVKSKAKVLHKVIVERVTTEIDNRCNTNSSVDELTDVQVMVLHELDVVTNTFSPVVERLHWMVTNCKLNQ